jgi:hypothetical protein
VRSILAAVPAEPRPANRFSEAHTKKERHNTTAVKLNNILELGHSRRRPDARSVGDQATGANAAPFARPAGFRIKSLINNGLRHGIRIAAKADRLYTRKRVSHFQ